jgi:integrase
VSTPRVPKTEKPVVSISQAHILLEHVRKNRLEMLLTLAITTGMRRGEMLALRWSDIDLVGGSLQIMRTVDYIPHYGYVESEPKTDTGRRKIMLAPFVMEMLNSHRAKQMEERYNVGDKWIDKNLVFCGLRGDYFNPNYLLRIFKKALAAAGLPHMHIHDLRHSAATILLSMNVHPKVVQELLGHSSIVITMDLYSHVLPSMQQDVIEKWDDAFKLLGEVIEDKIVEDKKDESEGQA